VKGYGETFERGLGRFEQVMTKAAMLAGRADAAAVVRELREAALRDETGAAFGEALRRVA
jgi:indolepyruvate ferredoxin oxidoreductase beta subunit